MTLPKITHLQFTVLALLQEDDCPGRTIREALSRRGMRRSGPAFYQMMSRLEDGGMVEGRYEQKIVDGQIIKQRFYTITPAGVSAWEATRDFYLDTIRAAERAPAAEA